MAVSDEGEEVEGVEAGGGEGPVGGVRVDGRVDMVVIDVVGTVKINAQDGHLQSGFGLYVESSYVVCISGWLGFKRFVGLFCSPVGVSVFIKQVCSALVTEVVDDNREVILVVVAGEGGVHRE